MNDTPTLTLPPLRGRGGRGKVQGGRKEGGLDEGMSGMSNKE